MGELNEDFNAESKKNIFNSERLKLDERIKQVIGYNNPSIKALYMVSALLNFNVIELFNGVIKDFIVESLNS